MTYSHRPLLTVALAIASFGCGSMVDPPGGIDGGPADGSTTCERGSAGCPCFSNGTCDADLRCDAADERCEPCPAGSEGCACAADGTCAGELECGATDTCVAPTCRDGMLGCACASSEPPCDGDTYCGEAEICVACALDVVGCPCAGGACGGGLVCDATSARCRPPLTCEDLRTDGRCAPAQICEESSTGGDAACVSGACVEEFRWSTALGECVPCASRGCAAEPSCDEAAPGSIASDCASRERTCVVDADGIGSCGDCVAGFADIGGTCRRQIDCGGRGACAADEYCDESAAGGPACAARPCADPSTVVDPDTGACTVTCTRDCALEGATGRYWPFADREGNCICETLPGYFFDNGGEIRPVLCDADADGWVRDAVRDPNLTGPTADPALAANVRCDIRAVDRVELRDEYGQRSVIESCVEGLLQDRTTAPCAPVPIRLLESRRNDIPGEAARLGEAPAYTSGGRRFHANELNALTKACVDLLGDYDDDGVEDIDQVQPTPPDTSTMSELRRLQSFAHFVELYRTRYVAPAAGRTLGQLVIEERSRCDAAFPLGYGADTAFDAADPASYWRTCERRRDPRFDADSAEPGFDFAQWSCAARSDTCASPAVPAHPAYAVAPDPDDALVRGHGLCNLGGLPPADGRWRGMHHHSQFQCVQAVAGAAAAPRDRELSAFLPGGDLVFNACEALDCAGAAGCTDTVSVGGGGFDPVVSCATVDGASIADGAVGWAAVRYRPYGHRTGTDPTGTPVGDQTYDGGCVNEDAEWRFLCPVPEFGRCAAAPTSAFGRYRCFGWDSLFLWASDTETESDYRRSSLVFAMNTGPAVNMSVWNVEPVPVCE